MFSSDREDFCSLSLLAEKAAMAPNACVKAKGG